jgi:hypothetical protein
MAFKYSNVINIRGAECDTDHNLVVAKVRKSVTVSKEAAQNLNGEIFNLRKLNELEVRKEYEIESTKSFSSFGELKCWQVYK